MSPHLTYDAIVLGGGPAGLSAALMLGRSRRRVLVIDAAQPRNRFASHMHGVLGHEGTEPGALLERGCAEAAIYGIEHRVAHVRDVTQADRGFHVQVEGETIFARSLVLATGATDHLPDIDGIAERWGTSVLHCPYCHGWEVRDQRLGLLVTSPLQSHLALLLRQLSPEVTVFAPQPDVLDIEALARLRARGVTVLDTGVGALEGPEGKLQHVVTTDGDRLPLDALFAGGTLAPHDAMLAGLGLARHDTAMGSFLVVDETGRTSDPRIWAAGNVVTPHANVPLSMSAGSMAGAAVNAFLAQQDADDAVASRDIAPADYWEERYAGGETMWSGRVNATLADVVATIPIGTALDLGCGEGGDVVWLASQGWRAHGIDISATAIVRAKTAAAAAGEGRATFEAADLSEWTPSEEYDLVTASFLHSPVALARASILKSAAAAVAPGGHLLVITHAAPPPWADPSHSANHTFLTAAQEVESLGLDPTKWTTVIAADRERQVSGPDDRPATLLDGVVLMRRRVP
ncbi:FAD-dependent oxidoreductase [Demequina sp. TTPB684]|uniref:SAM-dependent methyltransferase n=1 Tax=unclassified Demequina TaxID=2620311 RepID=UPI001CF47E03|nr:MULTISPECIES: SAM-dependent methyltransferase [unclassified Demequina]MCB2411988.1 FAD-dependent oxidoreductase [Demequina sp. TTPB684]UPU88453.1 FAD-dependent oxidoreductase [Demequina sp. TMPB413]